MWKGPGCRANTLFRVATPSERICDALAPLSRHCGCSLVDRHSDQLVQGEHLASPGGGGEGIRDRGADGVSRRSMMAIAVIVVLLLGLGIASDVAEESRPVARRPIRADSVILDFRSRQMVIVAKVAHGWVDSTGALFLWAYFTNPAIASGSWSDTPIRVLPDFSDGDSASVRAVLEPFHWSNNPEVRQDGYRAAVFVGADSAALPQYSLDRDRSAGVQQPVTVRR